MNRVARWRGDVQTTCAHYSSRVSSEPPPRSVPRSSEIILDGYADDEVTRLLATSFTTPGRRALTFHLAQAGLSFQCFREIARLLRERLGE